MAQSILGLSAAPAGGCCGVRPQPQADNECAARLHCIGERSGGHWRMRKATAGCTEEKYRTTVGGDPGTSGYPPTSCFRPQRQCVAGLFSTGDRLARPEPGNTRGWPWAFAPDRVYHPAVRAARTAAAGTPAQPDVRKTGRARDRALKNCFRPVFGPAIPGRRAVKALRRSSVADVNSALIEDTGTTLQCPTSFIT